MRRTPMPRGKGFRRPERPSRAPAAPLVTTVRPLHRAVMATAADFGGCAPVLKENAIQHEGYMALVRKLPCMRCGIVGFTQFCHADSGKGMAIKTDCRRGWPGCGPRPLTPGCHWIVGMTATYTKEQATALENEYGARTRAAVLESGLWPKTLPLWQEART